MKTFNECNHAYMAEKGGGQHDQPFELQAAVNEDADIYNLTNDVRKQLKGNKPFSNNQINFISKKFNVPASLLYEVGLSDNVKAAILRRSFVF